METTETKPMGIVMLLVSKLVHHPDNPRQKIGDITELTESVKVNGILQNLTVVPTETSIYYVVIGNRRLEAAKMAGLKEVPCIISDMSYKEQLSTMLTENMQRVDLTPYEQAKGFQMMLDLGESVEQIAEKSGFSQSTVRRRLEIAKLDSNTLQKVSTRQISMADFDELAKIENIEARNRVLADIGTANFNNKVKAAIEDQKLTKRIKEWLEVIRTFALETDNSAELQYVTCYAQWNLYKEVDVPKDSDTVKYYYKVATNGRDIKIYKERLQQQNADDAERVKRQQKEQTEWTEAKAISQRHRELRQAFVKNLTATACKNAKQVIVRELVRLSPLYTYGYDMEWEIVGDIIGVKLDEETLKEYDIQNVPGVKNCIETMPEKLICALVYTVQEDHDYWERRWVGGRYVIDHDDNECLNDLYDFLIALGYEMSDEEKQMQDGTHPFFEKVGGIF